MSTGTGIVVATLVWLVVHITLRLIDSRHTVRRPAALEARIERIEQSLVHLSEMVGPL